MKRQRDASSLGAGVREEQLLAADLVVGDGLLAGRRHHPVGEGLGQLLDGSFAGFTTITPYWLNRRLSPLDQDHGEIGRGS